MNIENLHMKAPKGTSSANIEGHTYQIPESGVIKVISPTHVETLLRHGFVETDPENVVDKINSMDDKDELVTFIEEHGGDADSSMSLKKLRRLARELVEEED